jgi:hypothetical protein
MSALLAVAFRSTQGRKAMPQYLARFRSFMMKSIETKNLSELHIFGLFFVRFYADRSERWAHTIGFEAVLRYLIDKDPSFALVTNHPSSGYIFSYMILKVQMEATTQVDYISDQEVYKLVRNLGQLARQLQDPWHFHDLLIDSVCLSTGPVYDQYYERVGRLVTILEGIKVDLFQFLYQAACADRFRGSTTKEDSTSASRVLDSVEWKLEVLRSSTKVQEIFRRAKPLKMGTLTE